MTDHERDVQELVDLGKVMLQGSLSQTMRRCGRPNCRCHSGQRHGPHTYLTFRKPGGKTGGVYVPARELERFRQGVGAWKRFQEVAKKVAERNRQELVQARRSARGGRARVRQT